MKKKSTQKTTSRQIAIRLTIGALAAFAYFLLAKTIAQNVYADYLYYKPTLSIVLAIIGCFVIVVAALVIGRGVYQWASRQKVSAVIITLISLTILLLPFLFRKAGTLADASCILQKDAFGNTAWQLEYKNISSVEISVRYGIQYEISFASGETIMVCSEELRGIKNFATDKNLMLFDQAISQFAEKTVSSDPAWIKPSNTKRFFNDEEVFAYFDAFFQEYYRE